MKFYLGWGKFLELCEHMVPDLELAIEKETGERLEVVFDYKDKTLLGEFPDEYLYALKRLAAHLEMKGKLPDLSFVEDLRTPEEDDVLIEYIDTYRREYKYSHLVFFSEQLGVYLPVKGLKEPLHFEYEGKEAEICSVGSLYELRQELLDLKEKLNKEPPEEFDESVPWHIEAEVLSKLLGWCERAIEEKKPLVVVGED
ncbi:MAG: hypothetical protein GXO08_01395 [Aquificae bacterium]|nr:hypothetical protein [Aquificota bacterium]